MPLFFVPVCFVWAVHETPLHYLWWRLGAVKRSGAIRPLPGVLTLLENKRAVDDAYQATGDIKRRTV